MSNPCRFIFIDISSILTHNDVVNKAIGASEYQFYNLIKNLAQKKEVYCFNFNNNSQIIDNVNYVNIQQIIPFQLNENDIIVFQRFFPNDINLLNKVINNKVYVWVHDLTCIELFIGGNKQLAQQFHEDPSSFKNNILGFFLDKPNVNFIFPSHFAKSEFITFFEIYGYNIDTNRLNIIYNILYEDEFINLTITPINKYQLVFASAWTKNIRDVIAVFDYIHSKNNQYKLVLMSPGWDTPLFVDYERELKEKYGTSIEILEPQNKASYAKVIQNSLCVLSSTFKETFGCVFAEAYYLGTPVIADIRSGGVCEIIDKDYVIDYIDLENVYQKVCQLTEMRNTMEIQLDKKFMLDTNLEKWMKL
jgi:glycosyltransferase involved in cell wall biosynthesis